MLDLYDKNAVKHVEKQPIRDPDTPGEQKLQWTQGCNQHKEMVRCSASLTVTETH